MAKKVPYYTFLRRQMSDLIEQLELPDLYKQSLRERWLDQTIWADKKAAQNQKLHYRLRITTIVGGIILPAFVGISIQLGPTNQFARDWFPPLTFALSQIIAVSAAVEEFCRFGDRWREYRQMAESLKAEGWQYLQLTGPYQPKESWGAEVEEIDPLPLTNGRERDRTSSSSPEVKRSRRATPESLHMEGYAEFAGRIEAIIRDDVKSYVSGLEKQQAKQEAQVEKILAQAQAVAKDKNLLNQMNPNRPLPPYPGAPGALPPGAPPAASYPGYPPGSVPPGYPPAPGYPPNPGYPPAYPAAPGYPPAPGYAGYPPIAPAYAAPAPGTNAPVPPNPGYPSSVAPAYAAVPSTNAPAAPQPTSVPTLTPMTSAATAPNGSPGIQPFSPGPKATELNAAILAAALSSKGMSSANAEGTEGGRNGCAWAVNQVLQKAGIPPLGQNPKYVPSLVEALNGGRGKPVSHQEAKAGDLVIAEGEGHVGIGLDDGCKTVLSNSSSRASFCWESDTNFSPSYGGSSTIYRLLR